MAFSHFHKALRKNKGIAVDDVSDILHVCKLIYTTL